MADTPKRFNAENGLSVGTPPVDVIDYQGNINGNNITYYGSLQLTNISTTGTIITTNTTASVNATSGALQVMGGAGIYGDLHMNGITHLDNATASVAYGTGSLVVLGGVGIAGAVYTNSSITAAGDVTAFSDIRLKDNIHTLKDSLSKVMQLRGVSFDKDGKASIGVIAQEVQKIIPEVVHEAGDDMKTLSVAYGNLVGVLIEAIKELKEELDELKGIKE